MKRAPHLGGPLEAQSDYWFPLTADLLRSNIAGILGSSSPTC
jgi:hypothetical protein